ncbi:MAG: hypothetical protein Tsb009_14170 [Planctomycetaceae bacterium]
MWFTETPWPPIMICAAGTLLLLIAWKRNARSLYLYGIVSLVIAAAAIFFIERTIVTEVEKVEQLTLDLTDAVKQDDVKKVTGLIDSFPYRKIAEYGMSQYRVDDTTTISDLSARWDDDEKTIISHFRATGRVKTKPAGYWTRQVPTRWELTWKKNENGEWKITGIQRLHYTSGEKQGTFDPP